MAETDKKRPAKEAEAAAKAKATTPDRQLSDRELNGIAGSGGLKFSPFGTPGGSNNP